MPEPAVSNASPLIFLARAGQFDLLRVLGPETIVPEAVAAEILRRGHDDPTARALGATLWLRRVEVAAPPASVLAWDLGAGETAVLTWALAHPGSRAIIDDLPARRCARVLGVECTGTLGIVLRAKQSGRIVAVRPVLATLREAGMYLSDRIVTAALELVGE